MKITLTRGTGTDDYQWIYWVAPGLCCSDSVSLYERTGETVKLTFIYIKYVNINWHVDKHAALML